MSEAEAPAGWLDIATAPKDGTRVLLYRVGWREDTAVGWYRTTFDEWGPVLAVGAIFEPTHWMPLPAAPSATTAPATAESSGVARLREAVEEMMRHQLTGTREGMHALTRLVEAADAVCGRVPAAPEVPNSPGFPDGSRVLADARDATGRSPTDYALEFAEYLAQHAERLMDAVNLLLRCERQREELDYSEPEEIVDACDHAIDSAKDGVDDAMRAVRIGVYEFRKRRDRAAMAAPTPQEPT